jgi:hypothetical protein
VNLTKLRRQNCHAAEIANGRVPVTAELSAHHLGGFQDPDLMLAASRTVTDNGADGVGTHRSHAVEQLSLWPVLEKTGKLQAGSWRVLGNDERHRQGVPSTMHAPRPWASQDCA